MGDVMKSFKIWLDDEREAPEGWIHFHSSRTCIAALDLLQYNRDAVIEELSLDHDLGDDEMYGTGYDVLLWIEEQVHSNDRYVPPASMKVHSANAGARPKMLAAIDSNSSSMGSTMGE